MAGRPQPGAAAPSSRAARPVPVQLWRRSRTSRRSGAPIAPPRHGRTRFDRVPARRKGLDHDPVTVHPSAVCVRRERSLPGGRRGGSAPCGASSAETTIRVGRPSDRSPRERPYRGSRRVRTGFLYKNRYEIGVPGARSRSRSAKPGRPAMVCGACRFARSGGGHRAARAASRASRASGSCRPSARLCGTISGSPSWQCRMGPSRIAPCGVAAHARRQAAFGPPVSSAGAIDPAARNCASTSRMV